MSSMFTFSNRSFILFALKKKTLFNECYISAFYEKMFNNVECLKCYTLWLLFEYKEVHKSCETNLQDLVTYFFLDFLKAGFHSQSMGIIYFIDPKTLESQALNCHAY